MRQLREPPTISVCIPAYNNAATFSRCLRSVLAQRNVTVECIISDDSDSEAIHEIVREVGDPRVVYAANAPALGAPGNWNAALAGAHGKIVTLLHQDDWYLSPLVLASVARRFAETGAEVLLCGRALYANGKRIGEYPANDAAIRKFSAAFPDRSLVVNRLGSPSVIFFAGKFSSIRYDTRLLYFSDTEYFARLFAAAGPAACMAEPAIGIEWGADGQISSGCLEHLGSLVAELAYALHKTRSGRVDSGLALSRFFAANARHWRKGGAGEALAVSLKHFSPAALAVAACALPIFGMHMAYRLAHRLVAGKPWG